MRNKPAGWFLPVVWLVLEALFVISLSLASPQYWQIWLETSLALSAVAALVLGWVTFFSGIPTQAEEESAVIYDATFYAAYPDIVRDMVAEKYGRSESPLWKWREGWNLNRFRSQQDALEYRAKQIARERMGL